MHLSFATFYFSLAFEDYFKTVARTKLDSPKQNPKAEERVLKRERSHRLGIAINHIINDIVKNSGLKALFLMS